MKRQIIEINEEKCNGCGACVAACNEGAIGLINGKAKLLRDDYCDGLGNCLPACPTGAISFTEREADAYDQEAVEKNKTKIQDDVLPCGCPGTQTRTIPRADSTVSTCCDENNSQLSQWPVQIKLIPVNASYFNNAHLLVAADCCAYAYGNFHNKFIKNKVTLIGCPKLDNVDYTDKLSQIIKNNNLKSITVVRMEVPCCGGIENAVINALQNSGKMIPWQIFTITTDGKIIE